MKRRHSLHKWLCLSPLHVDALIYCAAFRKIKDGVDETTRFYKTEPECEGRLAITRNAGSWKVDHTFGNDLNGIPLIGVDDIQAALAKARSWKEMEACLATYFDCCVYEFHQSSPNHRKLTAFPLGDD